MNTDEKIEWIESWKELKIRYDEEIEMDNDIETNRWLSDNAQKEIYKLENEN